MEIYSVFLQAKQKIVPFFVHLTFNRITTCSFWLHLLFTVKT